MMSSVCSAQEWNRKGKTDLYGIFQTMGGGNASGSGYDIDIDDTTVYGFGIGYNLDNHWNINTELLFGSTDLAGTLGAASDTADADIVLWNVNLDYNILEDRLTPVVSGGIGIMNYNGSGGGSVFSTDFSESNFSYNFGAGLRYDITDNLMLKAMYRITWSEIENAGDTDFDGVMVSIGYMF